jgi:hypothetical protein
MFHTLPINERRAAYEQAPVVIRARRQIARLQAVIDHGVGDIARAEKIKARFESGIEHSFQTDAYVAICNVVCTTLGLTLNDWSAAVDSVCWEIDRMERVA